VVVEEEEDEAEEVDWEEEEAERTPPGGTAEDEVKGFMNEGEVGVEGSSGKTSASKREKEGSIVVVVGWRKRKGEGEGKHEPKVSFRSAPPPLPLFPNQPLPRQQSIASLSSL